MVTLSSQQVTQLLLAWGQGDEAALERLIPLVHGELRRLARRHMGYERVGHSPWWKWPRERWQIGESSRESICQALGFRVGMKPKNSRRPEGANTRL